MGVSTVWLPALFIICSAEERNSYRFGITSVNDDKSLFFQVNYPFKYHAILIKIYLYCM